MLHHLPDWLREPHSLNTAYRQSLLDRMKWTFLAHKSNETLATRYLQLPSDNKAKRDDAAHPLEVLSHGCKPDFTFLPRLKPNG